MQFLHILEFGQASGWCPKFAPGLNIKIGIVQKVYEWLNYPFAKMILQWAIKYKTQLLQTQLLQNAAPQLRSGGAAMCTRAVQF